MAFTVNGTSGNDSLEAPLNQGGGTIRGLAGDDSIDVSFTLDAESFVLFGNQGNDTLESGGQGLTVVGGDGSLDGNDCIQGFAENNFLLGNGGRDTIFASGDRNTIVGGFDGDRIFAVNVSGPGPGIELVFGNEGADTIMVGSGSSQPGGDTVFAGQGNDSVDHIGGSGQFMLNENNDTFYSPNNTQALTVVGGNDSADGPDSIWTGSGNDVVFGNGGNDTIIGGQGHNTLVAGAGADFVLCADGRDFIFGNQDNDTLISGVGPDTIIGGQGDDSIIASFFTGDAVLNDQNDTILGSEGRDRINAGFGGDTISGGSDADTFIYEVGSEDGSATGPVELITDLNWAQDGFRLPWDVEFVATTSAGGAGNLGQAAANALLAAWQQNGSADVNVAAVFTFQGRTYLVADNNLTHNGAFANNDDLLIDITGATGSVNLNALNAI